MTSTVLTLVQPEPKQPKVDLGKARRKRVALKLELAFADALDELGWEGTVELLGCALEDLANEASHWYADMWRARSNAMHELNSNEELK